MKKIADNDVGRLQRVSHDRSTTTTTTATTAPDDAGPTATTVRLQRGIHRKSDVRWMARNGPQADHGPDRSTQLPAFEPRKLGQVAAEAGPDQQQHEQQQRIHGHAMRGRDAAEPFQDERIRLRTAGQRQFGRVVGPAAVEPMHRGRHRSLRQLQPRVVRLRAADVRQHAGGDPDGKDQDGDVDEQPVARHRPVDLVQR